MELGLTIDGKEKVFKQSTTTFKTMKVALEYQDLLFKQMQYYDDVAGSSVEDEIDDGVMDPSTNLEKATDLIVAYFDGQFTYDEFISAEFKDITEVYAIAYSVMSEILGVKEAEDDLKKAVSQQKKQIPVSTSTECIGT